MVRQVMVKTSAIRHWQCLQFLQWGLVLVLLLALVGCGGSGSGSKSAPPTGGNDDGGIADLVLAALPDAVNLVFSETGRLFVSTAQQVYEVSLDGETFVNQAIADTGCHFKGLATAGQYLYAVCKDGRLFAGVIDGNPLLTEIYQLANMCLPNGVALGADGNLYVVNGPVEVASLTCLLPDPKIVRLVLDPNDPLSVQSQAVWLQGSLLGLLSLGLNNTLHLPSGLAREGSFFYGTDGGSVYRVEQLPGGAASEVEPLFFRATVLGDLAVTEEGILVTDIISGTVLLLSHTGELLHETAAALLNNPGAVAAGVPPLFAVGDILATELPADVGGGGDSGDGGNGGGGGLLPPLPVILDGLLGLL